MKLVTILAAAPTANNKPTPVEILISGNIEAVTKPGERSNDEFVALSRQMFESQAEDLFQALRYSLPGGTIDRLAGKLLAYIASDFLVSHEPTREAGRNLSPEEYTRFVEIISAMPDEQARLSLNDILDDVRTGKQ